MKKTILLLGLCLPLTFTSYAQQKTEKKPELSKKEATKILESAWNDVKNSDSSDFIKLWVIDEMQWPYHAGRKYMVSDVKTDYENFRSYFDTALVKKLKFDEVQCDTLEHDDPHYEYAKYYIKAWFKYSKTHRAGFGFYMDYVNNKWLIRFSPDYSDITSK